MFKQIITKHRTRLFMRLVWSVFAALSVYSVFHLYWGTYNAAIPLLVGSVFVTPLLLKLEEKEFYNSSRLLLIVSNCVYIYLTATCTGSESVRYYFYPALLLPAFIYREHEKVKIISGVGITLGFLFLQIYGSFMGIPQTALPENFPGKAFDVLNIIGSVTLTYFFLYFMLEKFTNTIRAYEKSRELKFYFFASLDLLMVVDANGKIQKVNPHTLNILGYSKEELIDQVPLQFIHPEDVHKGEDWKSILSRENRWICKDGTHRVINWNFAIDQESDLIFCSGKDVTELRDKELKLNQTLDAIKRSSIVVIRNKNARITSINENYTKLTGYTEEELIGKDLGTLGSSLHSPEFYQRIHETIAQGKVWSGEMRNRAKNNEVYTTQAYISPIFDIEGKIESYISILFDLSRFKESERLLEEAQRVAKIGSWSLDIKKGQYQWSPQMFKLFELPEAIKPTLWAQYAIIHPDDKAEWEKAFHECLKLKKDCKMRFRAITSSGKVLWIEAIASPQINEEDQITSLSGTYQDITELVQAEERTREERTKSWHNAKLASLGEMSAGIAHEINNPLGIIDANISILQEVKDDPERLQKKIATIQRACDRITKIIIGLRKFARSSDEHHFKPHCLHEIIKDSLFLVEIKAKRSETEVMVNCESEDLIYCDEVEIEQVLVNLINNGIDAVKNLNEKWVKIDVFNKGNDVVVQVIDSGRGVDPEIQKKIFQPFFTTKDIGEGTGLGLSIAKGILDEHKASIEVLTINQHTCFEIRFKKYQEEQHAA